MSAPAIPPFLSHQPRERLDREGPAALTTVELMAIVLGTGQRGRNVVQVATALSDAVDGSLRRLAQQAPGALVRHGGIGRAKAARLLAALELGNRLARELRPLRTRVRSPEDVARLVGPRLRDLEVEEFHIVIVSTKRDIVRDVLITKGTLNGSLVHPREVFRAAIAEGAAGIFLVHNHPSGDPTPSPEDRVITAQLVEAGKLLGIPVVDHVIVAGDRWTSFVIQGLL